VNLGHLGQRRAIMLATGLAALQLVGITVPALAHSPTPQGNKLWSNGATSQYKWDATVPSAHWLRPAMTDVIQSGWASPSSNNSNGVRFSYGATGQGVVYYTSSSGGICGGGWLGCADARYVPTWKIWIRSNPITAGWENWCDLESDMGCPDAGRVAIHEVGHVGGYLEHYDTGFGATRMTPLPPTKDTNEWNTRTLGRCDEARLQLMYDLDSKWGAYANCFEDFPNSGPGDGLVTDLSAAPTNIVVCSGQQATVSGRLNVHNFANYAAMADNGVWGRDDLDQAWRIPVHLQDHDVRWGQ
jgi:hypothetical protein